MLRPPVPFTRIRISAGPVTVTSSRWKTPLVFDSLEAVLAYTDRSKTLTLHHAALRRESFEAGATGTIVFAENSIDPAVTITLKNHAEFLAHLADLKILEEKEALLTAAGLAVLEKDGTVTVPLTRRGRTLYAGPLPVASLP